MCPCDSEATHGGTWSRCWLPRRQHDAPASRSQWPWHGGTPPCQLTDNRDRWYTDKQQAGCSATGAKRPCRQGNRHDCAVSTVPPATMRQRAVSIHVCAPAHWLTLAKHWRCIPGNHFSRSFTFIWSENTHTIHCAATSASAGSIISASCSHFLLCSLTDQAIHDQPRRENCIQPAY